MLKEAIKQFKLIVKDYIKVLGLKYFETIEAFN